MQRGRVVVVLSAALMNTARYWVPSSEAATLLTVKVVEVAPGTSDQLLAPAGSDCHCTSGAGSPIAFAVKVTLPPLAAVASCG